MGTEEVNLVGDIGATNARLAIVQPDGALTHHANLLCEDYATIAAAIEAYIAQANAGRPTQAVLAVATAPDGDRVRFTNNPWAFSVTQLAGRLGIPSLRIINDFEANALAVPHLGARDVSQVGGGAPVAEMPIGVIGPGSGLGASTVVWTGTRHLPVPGEGGHVTMAAADAEESEVLALLRQRFDHVSAERVLSGPGLVNLYNALCEIGGRPSPGLSAAQITDPETAAQDACAKRAVAMFCAMLGTVAANLALTLGARGGIYIAGGIVPKLGTAFAQSQFRARFEDKGRLRSYLAAIPTYVVMRPDAALLGAAQRLRED